MGEPVRPPLIAALCNPELHGNPEGGVRVVETHISWVLLAGHYAYKIKKPVDLGFLDFSTLQLRRRFCLEELRLNRRLAPDLYLAVIPITGTSACPVLGGAGAVQEYAVKLRRFDERLLASRLIEDGCLTARQIDGLADDIAAFHASAARATAEDGHGRPEQIMAAAEHNFDHLLPAIPPPQEGPTFEASRRANGEWFSAEQAASESRLADLLTWTRAEFGRLMTVFEARKKHGFIRECHGDLHCGNLVLIEGRLIPFDCIEFSEDLRWIDTVSEIAFLFMDLGAHGRPELAWRLVNRYLSINGDYAGLELLRFYCVYRALVRAKVTGLGLNVAASPPERETLRARLHRYLDYANRARHSESPVLLITHGFSGSGKSFSAARLAERLPAIRIASDVERKRLTGFAADARTRSAPGKGIYHEDISRQTYAVLLNHARQLLAAGISVILDATYLKAIRRHACRALAESLGVRFLIVDFRASEAILRQRVALRLAGRGDPSEADETVLNRQLTEADELDGSELPFVLSLDAEQVPVTIDSVLTVLGKSR